MSTPRLRLAGLVVLAALFAVVSACGESDSGSGDDTLVIGGTQPLSGEGAAVGEFATRGAELAAKSINSDGGVLGRTIKFNWQDSQLDPQIGVQTAEKLMGDGIDYVLTGGSAVVLAQVPIAEREGALLLNPMAQTPALAGASKALFNMLPTSDGELKSMATLAIEDRGLKTIAILHVDTDLGTGDQKALTSIVEDLGGEIVADESYPLGATDMRAPLTRIKQKSPDALYIVGNPDEIGNAIKQASELGIDAQLLGRTANVSAETLKVAGDAANGMIGVGNVFRPDDAPPAGEAFAKAYQEAYGEAPSVYAAISYDTIRLLAQAVEDADSVDPEKVRDALMKIDGFDGVMGPVAIGDDQTVSYPLFEFQVVNGTVEPLS